MIWTLTGTCDDLEGDLHEVNTNRSRRRAVIHRRKVSEIRITNENEELVFIVTC